MSALAPSIPLSVEAIDATWLTAALRAGGHDVDVTAVEHVAVVGGNATKVRLRATFARPNARVPEALCVKVGMELQDPTQNLTGSTYDIEGRFYRDVAPLVGAMSVADCVSVITDPETSRCALVMADLIAAGGHFGDPRADHLADAQLRALLTSLARMHGTWWQRGPDTADSPAMLADLDVGIDRGNRLGRYYSTFDAAYVAGRFEAAGQSLPVALRAPELLVDRFWAMADRANRGLIALIHADPHLANIFVTTDASVPGGVGIADWQTMRWGRWAHDVAYLIGSSRAPAARRDRETGLLAHYLEQLAAVAGEAPSPDEARAAYAESMMYGLFGWLTAPAYFGYPPDFTNVYVERFAAAVLDHDTLDLLGDN
jgi:hypothetical protein